MSDLPPASPRKLVLISFSILFLELASIRWLNASVPVLSFFNNLILISCFFGLGVGCLLARRRVSLVCWYPAALLLMVLAVLLLDRWKIPVSYEGDVLFVVQDSPTYEVVNVSLAALAGFLVNMVLFVFLGQELGRRLINQELLAYSLSLRKIPSARLAALLETTDGFAIAEADLRIRGPGEFLGTRQHGHLPDLRLADLVRDGRLVSVAREAALATLREDPGLQRDAELRRAVEARWGERLALAGIG